MIAYTAFSRMLFSDQSRNTAGNSFPGCLLFPQWLDIISFIHSFFLAFLGCSGLSNQHPCCWVVVWVLHAAAAQPTHRPSGRRTDKWCGCVQRDRVLVSPGSPVPWRHSRILKRTSLGEKVVACAEAAPSSQHPSKLTFLSRELFHGCRTDKITYLQATCSTYGYHLIN